MALAFELLLRYHAEATIELSLRYYPIFAVLQLSSIEKTVAAGLLPPLTHIEATKRSSVNALKPQVQHVFDAGAAANTTGRRRIIGALSALFRRTYGAPRSLPARRAGGADNAHNWSQTWPVSARGRRVLMA